MQNWKPSTYPPCRSTRSEPSAIAASLKVLKPELERRKEIEAQAAELAKLRAEAAERAEKDRIEELARMAQDRRNRRQRQRSNAAAVETGRQSIDRRKIEDAEQRIKDAAAQAERDREAAVEAERKRVSGKAAGRAGSGEARAADEKHRNKVTCEAADALASECLIDEPAAHCVIDAIAKGLIPHITIQY